MCIQLVYVDIREVDVFVAIGDTGTDIVDIESRYGVGNGAICNRTSDSILRDMTDLDTKICNHIQMSCIEIASMGFVGVLTGLVVVGLEMQTFDIHMLSVAPVGIFGFLQYIVLAIIGHLDITHPGMHEFNDEGTGLFLLLFLLVFLLCGIEEELIVGRTVLRLTQQHLHSIDLELLKYHLSFQQRHQTEVAPYLLYK